MVLKPGEVQVWAEVVNDGKTFTTDKLTITIVDHAEQTIFEKGSKWKYLDNGSDQGTAWREPEFDDSSWKSAPAPLVIQHRKSSIVWQYRYCY